MSIHLHDDSALSAVADAIRAKAGTSAQMTVSQMPSAISNISTGITPTGKLNITDTAEKDVTNYATAQVVDANLVAGNIKSGTSILGITGSYSGSGGGGGGITLPANMAMGTFVVASRTQAEQTIPHGLGSTPTFALILADKCNATGTAYDILGGCTTFDLNSGTDAVGTTGRTYAYGYNGVRREITGTYSNVRADATNIYINGSGNYYLDPTLTYRWFAWAEVSA